MLRRDPQIETQPSEIVPPDNRDGHRDALQFHGAILEHAQRLEISGRRRRRTVRLEDPVHDVRGVGTEDAELGGRSADIRDLDVLAEHELRQMFSNTRGHSPLEIHQDGIAGLDDVHVGDHPALRGQEARVAARTGRERGDIVGQQPLQIVAAIGSGEPKPPAIRPVDKPRAVAERPILFE